MYSTPPGLRARAQGADAWVAIRRAAAFPHSPGNNAEDPPGASDNAERGSAWIDALEGDLAKKVAFPDAATEIRVLTALVQALNFRAPWHPQLPAYSDRPLALVQNDAAAGQRLMAAVTLSHRFAWLGMAEDSLRASRIAAPLLARDEIVPVHEVWASVSLAYAGTPVPNAPGATGDLVPRFTCRLVKIRD